MDKARLKILKEIEDIKRRLQNPEARLPELANADLKIEVFRALIAATLKGEASVMLTDLADWVQMVLNMAKSEDYRGDQ